MWCTPRADDGLRSPLGRRCRAAISVRRCVAASRSAPVRPALETGSSVTPSVCTLRARPSGGSHAWKSAAEAQREEEGEEPEGEASGQAGEEGRLVDRGAGGAVLRRG